LPVFITKRSTSAAKQEKKGRKKRKKEGKYSRFKLGTCAVGEKEKRDPKGKERRGRIKFACINANTCCEFVAPEKEPKEREEKEKEKKRKRKNRLKRITGNVIAIFS